MLLLSFFPLAHSYTDKFQIPISKHPEPRNGPPLIHWCTMCGADNRYHMLKETIEIIKPYFDKIHIIDNGSTDETANLVQLSPKVTYKRIEDWNSNWALCYAQSIRQVCKNEWFMFNDSDERPSPELLKNLRSIVKWANENQVNAFAVQSCHHSYDDQGNVTSSYEHVLSNPGFVKVNFLKRQDMVIKAFGGHTGFNLNDSKIKALRELNPKYFYNHYKSHSSMRVSLFTHGFMYPTSFSGLKPFASEILKLRRDLGINEMKQLFQMLYDKKIPEPMRKLIAGWEFASGEAKQIWELIIRDNCRFNLPTHCDKPCCLSYK